MVRGLSSFSLAFSLAFSLTFGPFGLMLRYGRGRFPDTLGARVACSQQVGR